MFGAFLVMAVGLADPSDASERIPREYDLEWVAVDGCPDADVVRERIARLRLDPQGAGTLNAHASVTLSEDGRFHLALRTRFAGLEHQRVVDAATCDELVETTALVVAVSLTPVRERTRLPLVASATSTRTDSVPPAPLVVLPPVEPTQDSAPSARRTDVPAPSRGPASVPVRASASPGSSRNSSRGVRPTVGASLGGEFGALPGLGGIASMSVGAAWTFVRSDLVGTWIGARRRNSPLGGRAIVQLGTIAPRVCGTPRTGAWLFPLCGSFEFGVVRIGRRGFVDNASVMGPWLAPALSAGFARRVGAVELGAAAQSVVPVFATRAVQGGVEVFAPRSVSFRAAVRVTFFVK